MRHGRINSAAFVGVVGALLCRMAVTAPALEPAGPLHGDTTNRAGVLIVPFIAYAPETETAFTLAAVYHFRMGDSVSSAGPSVLPLYLAYSQRKQSSLRFKPEVYLSANTLLSGELAFEDWPDRFYGVGPGSDTDDEEEYTSRNLICRIGAERRLWRALWSGVRFDWKSFDLTDVEPDGLLSQSSVAGSEDSRVGGLTASLRWDTRDDTLCPSSGSMVALSFGSHGSGLGGNFTYQRYRLDARRYQGLGKSRVLVLRGYAASTRGDVPFQEMSLLGDSGEQNLMRGYLRGRYRDRDLVVLESEYRVPLCGRVGMVFFGGVGNVAEDIAGIDLGDPKLSMGMGLRYRASRKESLNLRLDVAFVEESPGLYFKVFEAF